MTLTYSLVLFAEADRAEITTIRSVGDFGHYMLERERDKTMDRPCHLLLHAFVSANIFYNLFTYSIPFLIYSLRS